MAWPDARSQGTAKVGAGEQGKDLGRRRGEARQGGRGKGDDGSDRDNGKVSKQEVKNN